jgi:hypothetical protein
MRRNYELEKRGEKGRKGKARGKGVGWEGVGEERKKLTIKG